MYRFFSLYLKIWVCDQYFVNSYFFVWYPVDIIVFSSFSQKLSARCREKTITIKGLWQWTFLYSKVCGFIIGYFYFSNNTLFFLDKVLHLIHIIVSYKCRFSQNNIKDVNEKTRQYKSKNNNAQVSLLPHTINFLS